MNRITSTVLLRLALIGIIILVFTAAVGTRGGTAGKTVREMSPHSSSSRSCFVSMRCVTDGSLRRSSLKRRVRSIR